MQRGTWGDLEDLDLDGVAKAWFLDSPTGGAGPEGPEEGTEGAGPLGDLTRGQVMRVRYHLLCLLGFEPHEELCDLLYRTSRPSELARLLDRDFTILDGSVVRLSRLHADAFLLTWRGSDGTRRRGRLRRGQHW